MKLPTLSPCFAQIASQGRWIPARHQSYLDQAIVESLEQARDGELHGLVISMPPQHTKSMLCSHHLPESYLACYSDHPVILTNYKADFAASWERKARDLLERHGRLFGVGVSK